MPQDGSLFNAMGGDSPMFLVSNPSGPLDTSPLGYYVQQRERAQGSLAQKIASDMPKFDMFDDKAPGDPGDAEYTKRQIEARKLKIMNGIKNAGGIPTVYINSEEGKKDLSQLNNDVWNYRAAKNNNENRTLADKKIDDLQIGSQIRLDPKTGKPEVTADGSRFKRYGDWTKDEAMTPREEAPGVLSQKDFAVIDTRPKTFTDEVDEIAKNSKSTDWASAGPVPLGVDDNGNPSFVGTQGSAFAYSIMANTESSGHSNIKQLQAAANTLYSDLSTPAKLALKTQLYEKMEKGQGVSFTDFSLGMGKKGPKESSVDWKKFNQDDSYAEQVMQGYMYDRINQRLKPFESTGSGSKMSFTNLGQQKGGEESGMKMNLVGNALAGNLEATAKTYDLNPRVMGDKSGESSIVSMKDAKKVYSGAGIDTQLKDLNDNLKANPSTLQGKQGVIWNGKVNDLMKYGDQLNNLPIEKYTGLTTDIPMIYDKAAGHTRQLFKAEVEQYNKYSDLVKAGNSLSPQQQEWFDEHSPKLYFIADVNIGKEGTMDKLKGFDTEGNEVNAVDNSYWFGLDQNNDPTKVTKNEDGSYTAHEVLVPVEPGDVMTGSAVQQQYWLNQFPQIQKMLMKTKTDVENQQINATQNIIGNTQKLLTK